MAGEANDLVWSSAQGGDQDQFLKLLESGELSDMKVTCGKREWSVHKAILCARSGWFKRWTTSDEVKAIKAAKFKEHEIDCLLQYIYTGSINVTEIYPVTGSVASISIWTLGECFEIPDLCKLALDGFKDQLRKASWEFAGASSSENWDEPIGNCVDFVRVLYQYRGGPIFEAFGPTTLSFLVSSIHIFGESRDFKTLLRDTPAFSSDWAVALTDSMSSIQTPPRCSKKCTKCRKLRTSHLNRPRWLKEGKSEHLCEKCFPL
ncbi:hypothetical protein KVR01_012431 [Diaporthe batatas]|uniref:uncharacterized protein n=1 Tax=Diaporthe batatas TaxID=748121 RepID=UPI001D03DC09|nr:uncharacterized protein KVR01_012431 [Diaporthe batatas]KAG8157769.1 hypothetical protein KVR01_012431 [Diaporthe batatas]